MALFDILSCALVPIGSVVQRLERYSYKVQTMVRLHPDPHKNKWASSVIGSAPHSHCGGCRFKSGLVHNAVLQKFRPPKIVPLEGLEPPTDGSGSHCSIQLSYKGYFRNILWRVSVELREQ